MFKLIYKWTDKIKEKVSALSEKLGEKGQGIVEYAMIIAAVAIIAAVVLFNSDTSLEGSVTKAYSDASSKINTVTDHDAIVSELNAATVGESSEAKK